MKERMTCVMAAAAFLLMMSGPVQAQKERSRWSQSKANKWYKHQGWLRGCNFIPSSAINQLEMWQAETFDTATIDRELGFAASIGFNCVRVFLHHAAWQEDKDGFIQRVGTYLDIADRRGIRTIFVFMDDCWNPEYHTGMQPVPKTGIHNSGWLRDPGDRLYRTPELTDTLEAYVKDVLGHFGKDKRIVLWDLYNEPGNSDYGDKSLVLLEKMFHWARQVNIEQPVSAGVWSDRLSRLNAYQLQESDVITYHNYEPPQAHQEAIDTLRKFGRPLLCTEYMARKRNSLFSNIMPLLKKENIAAINWGLVSGKTNTIYAWDTPMPDGAEPPVWFHDIFRKDGSVYDQEEVKKIRTLTEK